MAMLLKTSIMHAIKVTTSAQVCVLSLPRAIISRRSADHNLSMKNTRKKWCERLFIVVVIIIIITRF